MQDYWKKALSNKFRNERKRHEKDNPLAQRQPQKKSKETPKETPTKAAKHGVKNYLPPTEQSEDANSIESHRNMMTSESKKKRQDIAKINHLMNITFADRRRKVVEGWSVADLKLEYPCLFNEDEVRMIKTLKLLSD